MKVYLLQARSLNSDARDWITMKITRDLAKITTDYHARVEFEKNWPTCAHRVMQLQFRRPFMKDVTNEVSAL